MIDIEKPKIEIVEISEDNRYGKFVCEPLERGYGTTFGNSLRRMLLSSLEGSAITSIRIDGVLHEFSTIPGVRDDVTNIVLNLKQLCLKMQGNEPKVIRIDVEGEKEVTAADIICDADIEILNPDLHIATVDATGKLKIEMTVARGEQKAGRHDWGNSHRFDFLPGTACKLHRAGHACRQRNRL